MISNEIKRHLAFNKLAERNGIVVFGGSEDRNIPLCELKQAFELDAKIYNRSVSGLSVNTAEEAYDDCVTELCPETVLLHLGAADLDLFERTPSDFDQKYRALICRIRNTNKKCQIAIVSLKNPEGSSTISEMNRHLKYIAESEQCEFADISGRRVWNPQGTKEVVSFVCSTGFVPQLSRKRPIYDLVKILFCYDSADCGATVSAHG